MFDQHPEQQNHRSRKRILGSSKPLNFDNSQPVWVKLSLVQERAPLSDDDDSVGTNGSGRNFNVPRSGTRNERGSNKWGWLFGYAVMSKDEDAPPPPPKDVSNIRSAGQLRFSPSSSNKSSPFGQIKLRKTGSPVYDEISKNGNGGASPRERMPEPKSVLIQDIWNTTYNGLTIDLTAKEAACSLLQANPFTESSVPPKNLIELTHLHEPSLIQSLRERYDEGIVYTFCGKILLALNPFQMIEGLYSDETMKQYWNGHDETSAEPHVYAIAHEAFTAMNRAFDDTHSLSKSIRRRKPEKNVENVVIDQSILVSGESGAGKTVTTKIVMQYLAKLSEQAALSRGSKNIEVSSGSSSMEQQVLQSNPILESFGNARTVRNDNSSRFGKFIEIQFDRTGQLMGASIKTYLLEKIRLLRQAEGERNYHIFYELLSGMKPRDVERKELALNGYGIHDFRITAASGTFDRRDGVKDSTTFSDLKRAMETVGFSAEERKGIFRVVSGLLHLSNIGFVETKSDTVILDETNSSLQKVLDIFGVDLESITNSLCTCTITVGNEVMKKNLSLNNVEKAVEGLMKATYGALFEHIVRRVNSSITVGNQSDANLESASSTETAFIKILDIFGFESFETNSFEQLCINYCNESLQQQFNKHIFKLEQKEYEKEGIAWSFISFPDNQDILDLIEKKHTGIFSILDEQCRLAKCTDQSFATATDEKCCENPRYASNRTQRARGLFSIEHYAGVVEYNSKSFLDKNKDELPKEATDFLLSSSASIFVELGNILSDSNGGDIKVDGSSRKSQRSSSSLTRASVGSQFASQLRILRENIDKTAPHYIRCLKPNDELIPDNFVPTIIADQLRCAGVLEAVRVSRLGYPQRYTKDMFVQRYRILAIRALNHAMLRGNDLCEILVENVVPQIWQRQNFRNGGENVLPQRATFDLVSVGVQLGLTKVFLRHQAFESLEFLRGRMLNNSATLVQSSFRMHSERREFQLALVSVLRLQCCIRRFQAMKRMRFLKESKSAIIIQSVWRGFDASVKFSRKLLVALWCQRFYRGNVSRRHFRSLQVDKKASIIQSWWRMTKQRNLYLVQQYLAFNLQQCFRIKQARATLKQLKIEAKDLSRVLSERDDLRRKTEDLRLQLKEANRIADEAKKSSEKNTSVCMCPVINRSAGEDKISESDNDNESWKAKYFERDLECRDKDEEILRLKKQIETMRGEMEEKESAAGSQYIPFSFKGARSIVSESVPSPNKMLKASLQSFKWNNNKSYETETTELGDSYSEDIPTTFGSGYFDNPIHSAIRAADDDALSVAVTNCEDVASEVNRGGRDGKTPLHLAISSNNFASAEFLLKNDSVVANTQDNDGNTPLHYAKNSSFVKLLLEVGRANPNIPNERGFCAIHVAVQRRDVESVRHLLSYSANPNVADDVKWLTPLHLVAQETIHDTNARTKKRKVSPVVEIARIFCDKKLHSLPDMNYQDKDGNTPLHHSSILQHRDAGELILLFLKNDANPNIKNNRGQTPLHLFMHNMGLRRFDFFADVVQLMLYQGFDTNSQSLNGCAAIHLAVYHHDFDNAVQFLERGAQLHLGWQKPARWEKYWKDNGSSGQVYSLDMINDGDTIRRLLSSISSEQTFAPTRTNCMQCKKKLIGFGKKNCHHCGSSVCSRCSENKLDPSFFPPFCTKVIERDEPARVCKLCEEILVARKEEQQTIMGRELCFHSRQDDVSMLDMESSFMNQQQSTAQADV